MSSFLIQRYFDQQFCYCGESEPGEFIENTSILCPSCGLGHIQLIRKLRGNEVIIHFMCSNYPDCSQVIKSVPLDTNCRFCNTPLTLINGDMMKVQCLKCKRSVAIPLLLRSWPQLIEGEKCIHGQLKNTCIVCAQSFTKRISVIDIEMPGVAYLWHCYEPHTEVTQQPVHDGDEEDEDWWVKIHGAQAIHDAQREWENEVNEERYGYMGDSSRSDGSGWYYSDYSNLWD